MILTDGVHLVSDTSIIELHRFVISIGMPQRWFQGHRIPHYDLLSDKFARRVAAQVAVVSTRTLVKRAIRATKKLVVEQDALAPWERKRRK